MTPVAMQATNRPGSDVSDGRSGTRARFDWRDRLDGRFLLCLLAVVMLGCASLLFEQAPERFELASAELVDNLDWAEPGRDWIGSPAGADLVEEPVPTVVLRRDQAQPGLPFLLRYLPIPEDADVLRLSANVRVTGVKPDDEAWNLASLHLEHFDARHRRLGYWPFRLAALSGDTGWVRVTRYFPLLKNAGALRFVAFQGSRSGTMEFSDLSIRPARETAASLAISWALRLAWFGVALASVMLLFRGHGFGWLRVSVVLLAGVLIAGSLVPQPGLGALVHELRQSALGVLHGVHDLMAEPQAVPGQRNGPEGAPAVVDATPDAGDAGNTGDDPGDSAQTERPAMDDNGDAAQADAKQTDRQQGERAAAEGPELRRNRDVPWYLSARFGSRSAHFAGYLVLALAAMAVYRGAHPLQILVAVSALAFATECLQTFMVTRDTEFSDMVANSGGIALGGAVGWGLRHVMDRFARGRPAVAERAGRAVP